MCHNMYFYMHKHNMCNALCLLSNHTVLFLDTLHNYHTETFNFDFESFIYWLKLNQMILILSIPWNTGLWALFFIFRNYILVWMTSCVLLKCTKENKEKEEEKLFFNVMAKYSQFVSFVVELTLSCKKCDQSTSLPSQYIRLCIH